MQPIPVNGGGSLSPTVAQGIGFGAMLAFGLFSVAVPGLFLIIFVCNLLIFLIKLLPDEEPQRLHSTASQITYQRSGLRRNLDNEQRK